ASAESFRRPSHQHWPRYAVATRGNEQGRPHAIRKMGQLAHIEMVDSIYYEFDDRSGPGRIVALDVTLPGNEQPWGNPRRHRGDPPPKIRFAPDSPLEGDGFEPSVP